MGSSNPHAVDGLASSDSLDSHNYTTLGDRVNSTVKRDANLAAANVVKFSTSNFLKDFIVHAFWPFSYPLGKKWFGTVGLLNRSLSFKWEWFAISQLTQFPALLFIVVQYYGFGNLGHLYDVEILAAAFSVLFRAAVVAIKYGIMPQDFHDLITTKRIPRGTSSREQLLSGWLHPDVITMERELDTAAVDIGVNLDTLQVQVTCEKVRIWIKRNLALGEAELRHKYRNSEKDGRTNSVVISDTIIEMAGTGLWGRCASVVEYPSDPCHVSKRALAFESPKNAGSKPDEMVSCKKLLLSVLIQSQKCYPSSKTLLCCGLAFALLGALVAPVHRVYTGDTPSSASSVLCTVLTAVLVIPGFATLTSFLTAGVIEYHRRYTNLRVLTSLISMEGTTFNIRDPRYSDFGFLSLRSPNNVATYTLCRMILTTYGTRFVWRIQLYSSVYLLFAVVFYVVMLSSLVSGFDKDRLVIVGMGLLLSVLQFFLCTLMAFFGGKANDQFLFDRACIHREQMNIAWELSTMDPADQEARTELKTVDHMLHRAAQNIKSDVLVAPVRFLGLRASTAQAKAMVIGVASVISVSCQLIYELARESDEGS